MAALTFFILFLVLMNKFLSFDYKSKQFTTNFGSSALIFYFFSLAGNTGPHESKSGCDVLHRKNSVAPVSSVVKLFYLCTRYDRIH